MSRFKDDEARRLRVRVAALTVAQVGPFTAGQLFKFMNDNIVPTFDPRWPRLLAGLKRSLSALVSNGDLTREGEFYALKRTARNGLVCAVLPEAPAGSSVAAPTKEQLMGSGRTAARARVAA